jgi:hypothetical protein
MAQAWFDPSPIFDGRIAADQANYRDAALAENKRQYDLSHNLALQREARQAELQNAQLENYKLQAQDRIAANQKADLAGSMATVQAAVAARAKQTGNYNFSQVAEQLYKEGDPTFVGAFNDAAALGGAFLPQSGQVNDGSKTFADAYSRLAGKAAQNAGVADAQTAFSLSRDILGMQNAAPFAPTPMGMPDFSTTTANVQTGTPTGTQSIVPTGTQSIVPTGTQSIVPTGTQNQNSPSPIQQVAQKVNARAAEVRGEPLPAEADNASWGYKVGKYLHDRAVALPGEIAGLGSDLWDRAGKTYDVAQLALDLPSIAKGENPSQTGFLTGLKGQTAQDTFNSRYPSIAPKTDAATTPTASPAAPTAPATAPTTTGNARTPATNASTPPDTVVDRAVTPRDVQHVTAQISKGDISSVAAIGRHALQQLAAANEDINKAMFANTKGRQGRLNELALYRSMGLVNPDADQQGTISYINSGTGSNAMKALKERQAAAVKYMQEAQSAMTTMAAENNSKRSYAIQSQKNYLGAKKYADELVQKQYEASKGALEQAGLIFDRANESVGGFSTYDGVYPDLRPVVQETVVNTIFALSGDMRNASLVQTVSNTAIQELAIQQKENGFSLLNWFPDKSKLQSNLQYAVMGRQLLGYDPSIQRRIGPLMTAAQGAGLQAPDQQFMYAVGVLKGMDEADSLSAVQYMQGKGLNPTEQMTITAFLAQNKFKSSEITAKVDESIKSIRDRQAQQDAAHYGR